MYSGMDIRKKINEIKNHYHSNLNNKYLKSLKSKIRLSPIVSREVEHLLNFEILYVDTRGSLNDLYAAIAALGVYIEELNKRVVPFLKSYLELHREQYDGNEKILFQMTIKNFPMNITILENHLREFYAILIEYDKNKFQKDAIYLRSKNINSIEKFFNRDTEDN